MHTAQQIRRRASSLRAAFGAILPGAALVAPGSPSAHRPAPPPPRRPAARRPPQGRRRLPAPPGRRVGSAVLARCTHAPKVCCGLLVRLTASWGPDQRLEVATVTGSAGGARLVATLPAP